jgi:effector-binding domain-containing protein
MQYDCKLIEQAEQPALCIRTRTAVENLPAVLGKSYGAIAAYLGELGEQPAGAPFVGYFNMDMQDLDIEIGFPLASKVPGKGEIQSGTIPGGKLATCLHIGPYSAVEPAYTALTQFVAESGYEATGAAYEFYLNDPSKTPQDQLQTQIVFPIKVG